MENEWEFFSHSNYSTIHEPLSVVDPVIRSSEPKWTEPNRTKRESVSIELLIYILIQLIYFKWNIWQFWKWQFVHRWFSIIVVFGSMSVGTHKFIYIFPAICCHSVFNNCLKAIDKTRRLLIAKQMLCRYIAYALRASLSAYIKHLQKSPVEIKMLDIKLARETPLIMLQQIHSHLQCENGSEHWQSFVVQIGSAWFGSIYNQVN